MGEILFFFIFYFFIFFREKKVMLIVLVDPPRVGSAPLDMGFWLLDTGLRSNSPNLPKKILFDSWLSTDFNSLLPTLFPFLELWKCIESNSDAAILSISTWQY